MIPKSISASSLETADKCLAAYAATAIKRGAGFGNEPALLGTTLHAALEVYTDPSLMKSGVWDLEFLLTCFQAQYFKHFGPNTKSAWYKQGMQILTNWHNRPDQQSEIQNATILSREVKSNFPVPVIAAGLGGPGKITVPCNYVIDRLDQVDEDKYRVVDYKSQRSPWGPDEMFGKIQPRIYALATQIQFPKAKEICVQYDYLRYDRTSVYFSRQDNADTWAWLKQALQRIVDTDENAAPETLNDSCRYCIRKLDCKTLQSNVSVGGVLSFDINSLADRFGEMIAQIDGMKAAADDVETQLLRHAQETGEHEWFTDNSKIKVAFRKTRRVNMGKLKGILGDELAREYGKVGVSEIDTIRADVRLTPTQRSLLDTAIDTTFSEPSIKVTKRGIKK